METNQKKRIAKTKSKKRESNSMNENILTVRFIVHIIEL